MAAIKEARENMGDYKLKTAKDYVVPESQRVNAEKKRIQLLNLLDQVKFLTNMLVTLSVSRDVHHVTSVFRILGIIGLNQPFRGST